jgi:hypothetical protein
VTKPAFLFATAAVAWGAGFFAFLGGAPAAALPLLVATLAWWSLHRTCAFGAPRWPATSITVTWFAFSLISAASVGLLLAPAALLLAGATVTVQRAN